MTRPPIPKKLRAEAWLKNDGKCTWPGCTAKGDILEHLIPYFFVREHKLENLEPRCRDHAAEKTVLDQANIGHVRRMAGESGQAKRRRDRKAAGKRPLIQSNRKLATRPFKKKEK